MSSIAHSLYYRNRHWSKIHNLWRLNIHNVQRMQRNGFEARLLYTQLHILISATVRSQITSAGQKQWEDKRNFYMIDGGVTAVMP